MYRIMIVDDSNIIRRQIERCGDKEQMQIVAKAENGLEALELYQSRRPDLVTMDLTMPVMDGIQCVKELIKIDTDAIILVVSALSDKYTALKAIDCGARGFLNKPFTEEQLLKAISRIMETSR